MSVSYDDIIRADMRIDEIEKRLSEVERQLNLFVYRTPIYKHWWSLSPCGFKKTKLSEIKSS